MLRFFYLYLFLLHVFSYNITLSQFQSTHVYRRPTTSNFHIRITSSSSVCLSTWPNHPSLATLIFSLIFASPAIAPISSVLIFTILFVPIIHLNIQIFGFSSKFCSAFLSGTSTVVHVRIPRLSNRTGSNTLLSKETSWTHQCVQTIPLTSTHHSKWSSTVEYRTPGIKRARIRIPFANRSEVWTFSFSPRRPSSLSCIHYDLAIDSEGNENELSSRAIVTWLECFPDKSS